MDVLLKPILAANKAATMEDLPEACQEALAGYVLGAAGVSVARALELAGKCTYNADKAHAKALAACQPASRPSSG